jgi:peptidoglycan/LPS O-acetylase OafA/YrhL
MTLQQLRGPAQASSGGRDMTLGMLRWVQGMHRPLQTIGSKLDDCGGRPSGFDYLRIGLSVAVIAWHTIVTTYGPETEQAVARQSWFPLVLLIVPCFFALSGFLVAGSLFRNSLHVFLTLRVVRILPALFCEVLIAALIIGPMLTEFSYTEYFSHEKFFSYFLNIVGSIQYQLPGLFLNNPNPNVVNQQLWTIPYELECYIALAVLTIVGATQHPRVLAAIVVAITIVLVPWSIRQGRVGPTSFLEGRLDVLVFLWGVTLYVFKRQVPLNGWLAATAAAAAWISVLRYETSYLGALPMAYFTVWLGLQDPRRIRLIEGADYSYGMYLYGYIIQQSVVRCLPLEYRVWWITAPVSLILAAMVAYLSWTWIEKKVMDQKKPILAWVNRVVSGLQAITASMFPVSRPKD